MASAEAPGATAYIGAGGGGDTVCAALRALAHPAGAGPCCVLGAGYELAEYVAALEGGAAGDRLPCGAAAAAAYLREAVLPVPGAPDVWRVGTPDAAALEALAAPLVPPERPAGWRHEARFKYKTLLEECAFAARLAAARGAAAPAVHMFVSTQQARGSASYDRMAAALRSFFVTARVARVVLLDAGGDIFDARRAGRDVAVLQACLALAPELRLSVAVEVYGVGVDAHADAPATLARLNAIRAALRADGAPADAAAAAADEASRAAFAALLRAEEGGLASEVVGEGRAMGNFLAAQRLLADVHARRSCEHAAYAALLRGLHKRVEHARGRDAAARAAFDAANLAHGKVNVLAAAATVSVFVLDAAALARAEVRKALEG
jgi:hypothetical protein